MKVYTNVFESITSLECLFDSWYKFRKGKQKRKDVQVFERNLERNIFELHRSVRDKTYRHGSYHSFFMFKTLRDFYSPLESAFLPDLSVVTLSYNEGRLFK